MPTSHNSLVEPTTNQIRIMCPKTIVDVGIGYGKWGKIVRELFPDCYLTGVEIYEPYITDEIKGIYDRIIAGDIREHITDLDGDLIIFGDVIEHLKYEEAFEVLNKAVERFKFVIVNTPNGPHNQPEFKPEDPWYNNIYEKHLCFLTIDDFKQYDIKEYHNLGGVINILIRGNKK